MYIEIISKGLMMLMFFFIKRYAGMFIIISPFSVQIFVDAV